MPDVSPPLEIVTPRSTPHWVDLEYRADYFVIKEDVRLNFDTTWRGEPAVAQMNASRSTVNDMGNHVLGEWQIWCGDSYIGTNEQKVRETTPTAQSRLSAQLRPSVEAWLASDAYGPSEADAYAWAGKQLLNGLRSTDDTKTLRRILEHFQDKIRPEHMAQLIELYDARDHYIDLLDRTRFPQ